MESGSPLTKRFLRHRATQQSAGMPGRPHPLGISVFGLDVTIPFEMPDVIVLPELSTRDFMYVLLGTAIFICFCVCCGIFVGINLRQTVLGIVRPFKWLYQLVFCKCLPCCKAGESENREHFSKSKGRKKARKQRKVLHEEDDDSDSSADMRAPRRKHMRRHRSKRRHRRYSSSDESSFSSSSDDEERSRKKSSRRSRSSGKGKDNTRSLRKGKGAEHSPTMAHGAPRCVDSPTTPKKKSLSKLFASSKLRKNSGKSSNADPFDCNGDVPVIGVDKL